MGSLLGRLREAIFCGAEFQGGGATMSGLVF